MTRTLALLSLSLVACQLRLDGHAIHRPDPAAAAKAGPHASPTRTAGADDPPSEGGRMAGVVSHEIDRKLVARELAFARSCFADYDDTKARWAPNEAKLRARFTEIQKMPTYYARRDALAELAKTYFATLKEAKLDVAGADWDTLARSGLAYEVDAYIAAQNRERGIAEIVRLFTASEPPPGDDVLAGDLYCERATQGGSHNTHFFSGLSMTELLPSERGHALDAYKRAAAGRVERDFALAPAPKEHFTSQSLGTYIAHSMDVPAGAGLEVGGVLKDVRRGDKGATLRLVQAGTSSRQHDCVETNKVDHVDADGRVRYRENCEWSFAKSDVVYVATFPDVPADLAVGDWVDFTGVVQRVRKGDTDRGTQVANGMTFELAGTLVNRVSRAKHKGDEPSQFGVIAQYGSVH